MDENNVFIGRKLRKFDPEAEIKPAEIKPAEIKPAEIMSGGNYVRWKLCPVEIMSGGNYVRWKLSALR